jgi:hypothetical protein
MRQLVSMGALAFAPARPAVWVEYHSKRFVGAQERWSVGWHPERYVRAIACAACGGANSFVVTDGHFLRTARAAKLILTSVSSMFFRFAYRFRAPLFAIAVCGFQVASSAILRLHMKKGPDGLDRGLSFLVAVMNYGLAARTVIMILLDHGGTLGRLTLLNNSTVAVAVNIPMILANGHTCSNRSHTDANTDILSKSRGRKRRQGRKHKSILHENLLSSLT